MKFVLKTDVCDLIWECQTLETSILAVTVWTLKERVFTKDDAQASLEIVSLENACGGEQISLFWHNSNRYDEVLRARHRVTNGCDGWHVSGQVQQAAVRLPDERGPHKNITLWHSRLLESQPVYIILSIWENATGNMVNEQLASSSQQGHNAQADWRPFYVNFLWLLRFPPQLQRYVRFSHLEALNYPSVGVWEWLVGE